MREPLRCTRRRARRVQGGAKSTMNASLRREVVKAAAGLHWIGLTACARKPRILMYHSIVQDGSPYARAVPGKYVEESVFARSMEYVKRFCSPLGLAELVACYRKGGRFPRNAVAVTFDDGYANNFLRAYPILNRLGIPATFFIATGFVDGTASLWTDIVDRSVIEHGSSPATVRAVGWMPAGRPDESTLSRLRDVKRRLKQMPAQQRSSLLRLMAPEGGDGGGARDALAPLTWEQVRTLSMAPGMTVAPHTVTHPVLSQVSPESARREIADSRDRLTAEGARPASFFAYPYGDRGDYSEQHMRMVEELAFDCAVATHPALVSCSEHLYALPRYEGKNDVHSFICHVSGIQSLASRARGRGYERSRRNRETVF